MSPKAQVQDRSKLGTGSRPTGRLSDLHVSRVEDVHVETDQNWNEVRKTPKKKKKEAVPKTRDFLPRAP